MDITGIKADFKGTEIFQGDTLQLLRVFPDKIFGGIITDPPYSSGASGLSSRQQSTAKKYCSNKTNNPFPDFEGDARDQRSWTNWMTIWLSEARRISVIGAPICIFTDWRQLPSTTDALQFAGWIWRGIGVWDKINARPQLGRIRQQAEFIVWGSNGDMPTTRNAPVISGVLRHAAPASNIRKHQTEKSLDTMRELVRIVEPGEIILDPFAGSGTTIEAAKLEGHPAVGIELSPWYAKVAKTRIT